MLTRLRTVLAVAMLTVATYAVAVEPAGSHPDTYVVRKGDTLWDIAARFLNKPWLWPEIWQANPQVANPHLIYPGDVLSLAYMDRVGVRAGPREDAPIGAIPLSEIEPFLKNLRVVDDFGHLPYVVGFEDNRLRGSSGLAAYVKDLDGAQAGQRYAVVRPTVRYALPRTFRDLNANGRPTPGDGNLWKQYVPPSERNAFLGHELAQVNIGTVTRLAGNGATVATLHLEDGGHEVRAGDRLIPVEAQPYDLQFFPHAMASVPAGVRVLAVADSFSAGGPRDVVALSAGRVDGVDNGAVFSLWRDGSHINNPLRRGSTSRQNDRFSGGGEILPDEYAAHAMVFRTFDKVSYALVMDGVKPVRVGYEALHPDAQ
ncbi:peptidoglycan-binding protein LysM [Pseudoxanthomonas broegbernensis]|uniref:Peptidoglycan-binding protein LysM n=1 Tax=Pseudoxanthomonas broegbernensis TaxID=83619 RepID=A0A7V8K6J3_9GAMM|nr:LysM domain-containing protein [Pseudoxanthomonas broegbernensis]KAF1685234.1 peptidoglycan-binding protein LysM [Pseudoxanthomonas broegbernensis]MBB6066120.1 hypothetical protein [Pseudoxanthomonas broegbernensis]